MAARMTIERTDDTTRRHVCAGLQCPECHGVQVQNRTSRFAAKPIGFECRECGCMWDEHYYA